MNKPHKHAEVIKAWADGKEIEYKTCDGDWRITDTPCWTQGREYRVKPHKWQKEMDAFARGEEIQYRDTSSKYPITWYDSPNPYWYTLDHCEYRIKPKQISHIYKATVGGSVLHCGLQTANLKLSFEDGVLVSSEVLK